MAITDETISVSRLLEGVPGHALPSVRLWSYVGPNRKKSLPSDFVRLVGLIGLL